MAGDSDKYQIDTGLDNGTATSGYWYFFDDHKDKGESKIVWPVSLVTEYSETALDNVIDECEGICGRAELNSGMMTFQPYVGVAFDVAGTKTATGGPVERADATSWGGLCIAYTSDMSLLLEISGGADLDSAFADDLHGVNLKKSEKISSSCFEWSAFVQAGWGVANGGVAMTSMEVASTLASVRIKIQGRDGSYNFNIRAVGTYLDKDDIEKFVSETITRDSIAAEEARQDSIAREKARQDSIAKELARLDSITRARALQKDDDDDSGKVTPSGKFVTWRGEEGAYVVNTGLDNGTNTSGYWYVINDSAEGGKSAIDWNGISIDEGLNNVIDECGGICGTAVLDVGQLQFERNPFMVLAFDVAGIDSEDDFKFGFAPATDWGGLCVSYSSDVPMVVELSTPDDKVIAYDYHKYEFPKSATVLNKCAKWSDFEQASWGLVNGGVSEEIEYIVNKLKTIRFKFQAEDGSYKFNIKAVGPYTAKSEFPVGHDVPDDFGKKDSSGKFVTWRGDEGIYSINTGLDNGTKTSGYWYFFNDHAQGGKSSIFDITRWDYTYDYYMDDVIAVYDGVGGTAILKENSKGFDPYVGAAFNVAGNKTDDIFDEDLQLLPATLADASDWGGLCITYTSETEATLEMGFNAKGDSAVAYDNPKINLPKASKSTSKCAKWSEFKQSGFGVKNGGVSISGEKAATKLASVRFKIQGKPGEYKFNIQAIGSYDSDIDAVKVARQVSSATAILSDRQLSFEGFSSTATVQVVDVLGHVVMKSAIEASSSLDLSRLDAGLYIVRAKSKSVDFTGKIVLK